MHGGAQGGYVAGWDVLHLVDENGDARTEVGGDRCGLGEQLGQVDLQVAGIGAATDGRHVDAQMRDERPLGSLRVARGEGLEHAEEVLDPVRRPVPWRQFPDRHVQRASDRPADRLVGPRLDLAGPPQPLQRN